MSKDDRWREGAVRSLRSLFPRVAARRVWALDGTPIWEFRFTSRPAVEVAATPAVEGCREPVRFVTSRGVEIGGNTLRIDQVHHRIRTSGGQSPAQAEDVEPALVELAAHPEDESAQHRVVDRLEQAHGWFQGVPVLDISAASISGEGLGHSLDGVFVWRAEGTHAITYLVSPDPGTRDLLAADPDLVRALVRAACPDPEDALGELESSLREALTRLGVVNPGQVHTVGVTPAAELVLRVESERISGAEPVQPSADREKSESERALSEELAELARKVGTASVRKPPVGHAGRALEAG
ncbi:MAG TPA: hypothetical protein VLL08_03430 [Kineosporiaceae bacterium]|nr:hypothetical protein [Kineosporiaceae bacterium]